jgi:secreted trypsin-like serine protease
MSRPRSFPKKSQTQASLKSVAIGCWILAGTALVSCRHQAASNLDIIGGEPVVSSDPVAQTTVMLTAVDTGRPICTATLLTDQLALTAAHCFEAASDQPTSEINVVFGHGTKDKRNAVTIKAKAYLHPEFWDIALLKLAQPAPDFMKTGIKIPDHGELKVGSDVILGGYGVKKPGTAEEISLNEALTADSSLTRITVKIDDIHKEKRLIVFQDPEGTRSACFGDSGGPMFLPQAGELQLVGVTRGNVIGERADCRSGRGEYTDATQFKDFIEDGAKNFDSLYEQQLARWAQKPELSPNYFLMMDGESCVTINQTVYNNMILGQKALCHPGVCPDTIQAEGKTFAKLVTCPESDGFKMTIYENKDLSAIIGNTREDKLKNLCLQ